MPDLHSVYSDILVLEAQRESDPATFYGVKPPNGGHWSGSGIREAKRLRDSLTVNPQPGAAYQELVRKLENVIRGHV